MFAKGHVLTHICFSAVIEKLTQAFEGDALQVWIPVLSHHDPNSVLAAVKC